MDFEPEDKSKYDEQLRVNPRLKPALKLLQKGHANTSIAKELGVHPVTVRSWFRKATLPARRYAPHIEADRKAAEDAEKRVMEGEDAEDILESYSNSAAAELRRNASEREDEIMAEVAAAQQTPADKYQHYIAAAGIKLLRDSIKNLKAPRTVRELSELDQLIRRNLGLNAKNTGGQSRMAIDISILNNGIADKGKGSLSSMKKDVVEAEVIDEEKKQ